MGNHDPTRIRMIQVVDHGSERPHVYVRSQILPSAGLRTLLAALCPTAIVVSVIVLTGCTRVVRPQPQTVTITYKPAMPSCYIGALPEPPSLLELNFADDDIMRRTSVHYLTGNEIIQYEQHIATWMAEVRSCLYQMQGVEP